MHKEDDSLEGDKLGILETMRFHLEFLCRPRTTKRDIEMGRKLQRKLNQSFYESKDNEHRSAVLIDLNSDLGLRWIEEAVFKIVRDIELRR